VTRRRAAILAHHHLRLSADYIVKSALATTEGDRAQYKRQAADERIRYKELREVVEGVRH
jgi:hypothetical protein